MLRDDTHHKTWPFSAEQKFPGNNSLHKSHQGEFPELISPIILLSASPNIMLHTHYQLGATQDKKVGQSRVTSYTSMKPGATRKKVQM